MSDSEKTTHRFQAEVTQVLSLVINSLYSNKDIFLRELLSNASDALDKLRFAALTEPELNPEGQPSRIFIRPDRDAKTLTIGDTGIGMSAEQLTKELGTVAHSGSRAFLEKLEEAKKGDVNIIGQFGVGFYSAYLVADRVEVTSRAAGAAEAHLWTSDGAETFTLEAASRDTAGTSVVLHLKEDCQDFLDEFALRALVKRYSDFLDYPIELDLKDKEPEVLNEGKAVWQRSPSEVSKEQYEEFYKHLTHDHEPPLAHRHFRIEGTQLFSGLVFVPKRAPFDLFHPESTHGVRLYVKRVFIMDDCDELLPRWMRFVKGVVDSEDLPLNVSREILQDSKLVKVIRKQVVKQVFDALDGVADEDSEQYDEIWRAFGSVLKEGLHFEPEQRDRLIPLLRYESTRADGLTSLAGYKERMVEGQPAIYYVIGESRAAVARSPHLEVLKKRNYEVLFMTDPVDQFAVAGLDEYEGTKLVSVTDADLKLDDADETPKEDLDELRAFMRARLQEDVSEVRVSTRLTDSPVCLVIPEGGVAPHVERFLRATQEGLPKTKRILEINPEHDVIRNLETLRGQDPSSPKLGEWVDLLLDQALLAEGSPIDDPARFATRLTSLLAEASATEVRAEPRETSE